MMRCGYQSRTVYLPDRAFFIITGSSIKYWKSIRNTNKELQEEIERVKDEREKLIGKQKNYISTDLHELNNLVSIFERMINPDYKGVLKRLAKEIYEKNQKRHWSDFVDDLRKNLENTLQFNKKIQDNVENGITKEDELLILINESNQQISNFINIIPASTNIINVDGYEAIKKKYNDYCDSFNAFLDRYDIFQIYIVVKYKNKYKFHPIKRIEKMQGSDII